MSGTRQTILLHSLGMLGLVLLMLAGCSTSGGDEVAERGQATTRVTLRVVTTGQSASLNAFQDSSGALVRQEAGELFLQVAVTTADGVITATCTIPAEVTEPLTDTCQDGDGMPLQSRIDPPPNDQFRATVMLTMSLPLQDNLIFAATVSSVSEDGMPLFRTTEDSNGNCLLDAGEDTNGNGQIDDALTVDLTAATDSVLLTLAAVQADLALTKSDTPDPATAGTLLTYDLTVTNNCPAGATEVTVADTLPLGVTLTSATPDQGSCNEAGGVVTCDLGSLARRASATIAIDVTVDATTTGSITNLASVDGSEPDPDASNNTATQTTQIVQAADLAITKSDAPDPVAAGAMLTYTLTVANHGPSEASDVTVSDLLPAASSFASATPDQGSCSNTGGTVTCNLGTLAVDASVGIAVVVTVDVSATGSLTNTVSVDSGESDPEPTNNTATTTTAVIPSAVNPNTATTTSGQMLTIAITDPDHASTVAVDNALTIQGNVSLTTLEADVSVLYVVDVSSTADPPISGDQDCNGDGLSNAADDFNGDGVVNILDCEISALSAINASVAGTSMVSGGIVLFAMEGASADVDPRAGDQAFTAPLDADKNANGTPDLEEVARSLDRGTVSLFALKDVGTSTFFDAALAAVNTAFASHTAASKIAFFFSDGDDRLSTGAGSPLAATAAAGTVVHTFDFNGTACGAGTDLQTIADTTGGTCTRVIDPSTLSATLPPPTQQAIDRVEVSINNGAAFAALLGANGSWSAEVPAGTLTPGVNRIEATAFASDGTGVTASLSVVGVVIVGNLNNDGVLDTADVTLALAELAALQSSDTVSTSQTNSEASFDTLLQQLPTNTRIVVSAQGETSGTLVTVAGTVAPGSIVHVSNETTGATVSVSALHDGTFGVDIEALPGDLLIIAVGETPIRFVAVVRPAADDMPRDGG